MDIGIPINLGSRRLKNFRIDPFGKAEHVDRSMHTGFNRLNGILLIVDRRRGTCQIVNLIDFQIEGKGDIMADKLKMTVVHQMINIPLVSCEKIVNTDDIVSVLQKPLAEMGAEKTASAGDKNIFTAHSITPFP